MPDVTFWSYGRPPSFPVPSAEREATPGLADDAADGLQRRELLAVSDVQGLVGDEVLGGQDLPAGGAHLAVQLGRRRGRRGRSLPGVLLVAVLLSSAAARLLLRRLAVSVGREQLLLLGRVGQQHQQLVEDAVEVVAEQLLAAAVVVGRRYHTLQAQREREILAFQGDKRKESRNRGPVPSGKSSPLVQAFDI